MATINNSNKKLSIYVPSLPSGGIERLYLNLAPFFLKAGLSVTFLLDRADGTLLESVPDGAKVVAFGSARLHRTLPALIRYLRQERPDILLTAHRHKNIIGIWADIASLTKTCHVASVHSPLKVPINVDNSIANYMLPFLHHIFLRWAGEIVAVSNGIADEISAEFAKKKTIHVIQNGVITQNFSSLLNGKADHPWLQENRASPTFLAAGRLDKQKDFPTLIMAFAEFIKTRHAKLVIFGEGQARAELQNLANRLGISEHFDMPGFTDNIFPSMRMSSAFILSSAFEGAPLVLAEALACGTPIISTDCRYGPSEILDHGKYGLLVPVGDWRELSNAMHNILASSPPKDALQGKGQSFLLSSCAEKYLRLFDSLSK